MSSFWRPLTTAFSEFDTPPFLIKYEFDSASYSVSLTDLKYMWTETLDRKQIIKRALNIETSIDPSEDASQMQLLLRHVRDSLEGRNDTTIFVHGDGNSDKLTLSASINLPSPLLPLKWPIHLIRVSEAAFTNQFVLPSIRLVHSLKAQVNSLLQHIKEKDHVIDKLIDKMQSDGTDLGRIFPGAPVGKAGSRLKSREAAAKVVKGLGDFDENQWRRRLMATNETVSSIDHLVSSVFASDLIDMRDFSQNVGDPTGWRISVPDEKTSTHKPPKVLIPSPRLEIPSQKPYPDPNTGNDCQRQSTPPYLRLDAIESARDKRKNVAVIGPENDNNGDSTTDESDRDDILTPSNDVDLAMRLNEPQRHTQPGLSMKVDTATAKRPNSESVLEGHTTQSPSASPPKPKHKLGKVGGKAKEINATPDSRKGSENHSNYALPINRTSKRPDLISNDDSQSSKQVTELGKPAVQHDQGSPGKVSDEQANENRKRLQHDLERMSKAVTKKKRKF